MNGGVVWVRGGVVTLCCALCFALCLTAQPAHAYHVDPAYGRDRTALAVVHPDGRVSMSPEAEEARPALSLSKLYLGYYVLYNGTKAEKRQVKEMIVSSDDAIASRLDAAYPEAISTIAEDFDLATTERNGYWGKQPRQRAMSPPSSRRSSGTREQNRFSTAWPTRTPSPPTALSRASVLRAWTG